MALPATFRGSPRRLSTNPMAALTTGAGIFASPLRTLAAVLGSVMAIPPPFVGYFAAALFAASAARAFAREASLFADTFRLPFLLAGFFAPFPFCFSTNHFGGRPGLPFLHLPPFLLVAPPRGPGPPRPRRASNPGSI